MPQQLDDQIRACHLRAQQCRTEAELAQDTAVRVQLQDLERQWLHVARSYEFIENLERLLLHHQKDPVTSVEKLGEDAGKGEGSDRQTTDRLGEQTRKTPSGDRRLALEQAELDQPASVSWWAGGEMPTDEGSLGVVAIVNLRPCARL
jgi:hypothetical protein